MAMELNHTVEAYHEAKFIDEKGVLRNTRVPVVQELVRQGLDFLPQRFIRVTSNNPLIREIGETSDHPPALPCIDMSKLAEETVEEDREVELRKLGGAAKEWGMFLIQNHGIETKILEQVNEVVKGFFGLSFQEKKASVGSNPSVDNMGYGRNYVKSEDQVLDWIDRLTMKAAPTPRHDATAAEALLRVWPQNPPNFRQAMEKYVEEARKICDTLLQALAETLSVDRRTFIRQFDEEKSEINVRVNYYPPCPRPDLALGITPHSDPSALSVLVQFEVSGGLQVFKDMKWVTAQWPVDALLINLGDLMEILSNGCFQSSWHRAVTQKDVERFSVALFYHPPSAVEIVPLKDVKSDYSDHHVAYKKVVIGEYLENYYKVSPTITKEAIKFAQNPTYETGCLFGPQGHKPIGL